MNYEILGWFLLIPFGFIALSLLIPFMIKGISHGAIATMIISFILAAIGAGLAL